MTAGKPIIAIPFFGDQPLNALLMKNSGVAELVGKIPNGTEGASNPYKESWMTEDTVYEAVTKARGCSRDFESLKGIRKAAERL